MKADHEILTPSQRWIGPLATIIAMFVLLGFFHNASMGKYRVFHRRVRNH